MVDTHSEAVRPSLNVASKEEIKNNGLSHHGEAGMQVEDQEQEGNLLGREVGSRIDQQKEDADEEEEEDEAQEAVTRKAPKGPTKEEREKHEATRSWKKQAA